MVSGGHARSGPAPDPSAIRRERDKAEWTTLPDEREGPAPDWPLSRPTRREATLWAREWRRPQAVMWERLGQEAEVAGYVRQLVRAEQLDASTADRTLLLRMMDTLGLTTGGLARNRWRIGKAAEAPRTRTDDSRNTAKARLAVIDGRVVAAG